MRNRTVTIGRIANRVIRIARNKCVKVLYITHGSVRLCCVHPIRGNGRGRGSVRIMRIGLRGLFTSSRNGALGGGGRCRHVYNIVPTRVNTQNSVTLSNDRTFTCFHLNGRCTKRFPVGRRVSKAFNPEGVKTNPSNVNGVSLTANRIDRIIDIRFRMKRVRKGP